MSHIRTNALELLKGNFQNVEGSITLREYVQAEAGSDPGFFRWLFNEELAKDFDTSLTDEQKAEYSAFLATL